MFRTLSIIVLLLSSASAFTETYKQPNSRQASRPGQKRKKIKLRQIMTDQEYKRNGLKKLSAQELGNLESWMSEWRADEIGAETSNLLVIKSITRNGKTITLADGSEWEVSPFEIRISRGWTMEQRIEIRSTNRLGDYFKLKNLNRQESLTAKMKKPPGESEVSKANPNAIESIGRGAESLTLRNGSLWKIGVADRSKLRRWKKNQRIQIMGSYKPGRTVSLYNLENRQTIKGTLIYEPPKVKDEEQIDAKNESEQE